MSPPSFGLDTRVRASIYNTKVQLSNPTSSSFFFPKSTFHSSQLLQSLSISRPTFTHINTAVMNLLATPPPPHHLSNPRLSPSHSSPHFPYLPELSNILTDPIVSSYTPTASTGRKRKAEDDEPQAEDRMSFSPSNSPAPTTRSLPAYRHAKRTRSGPVGRPLALPRLLETLDADSLRAVLQSLCTRHPGIASEVEHAAPRPSVPSALDVLKNYESALQASFPFGGDSSSDYAYNRVRESLMALLDALAEFTPHFLPPNETQASQSLTFLDGATDVIHRLPDWSSFQNSLHKQNAYEEISGAWALSIREAAKRAGGMQLQYGGWNQKLAKHNQQANGKLQDAVNELSTNIGWMGGQPQAQQPGSRGDDLNSVRQELLAGTYGKNLPVRVGPW